MSEVPLQGFTPPLTRTHHPAEFKGFVKPEFWGKHDQIGGHPPPHTQGKAAILFSLNERLNRV